VDRKDRMVIVLLAALVLGVSWRAVSGGIFYSGDVFQLQYPLRSAYAAELQGGSLPLWTPLVSGGYPLLAEGQLGALYPPNLILHALLPVPIALNVFILAHFVWAALGAYAFARRLSMRRTAALTSALVYALGGFLVGHLTQVNTIAAASWLPWVFLSADRLLAGARSAHPARHAAALALAVGMGFLAGQPQIGLLSLMAVLAYALYLSWTTRQRGRVVGLWIIALLLGVALAAAQFLPSQELGRLSVPAGDVDPGSLTSLSLHPRNLLALVSPFISGGPSPDTSAGLAGYVGVLPLLLALLAPFIAGARADEPQRRVMPARFFAGLAVAALLLSLGRWNPLYGALLRLPGFSLLTVPGQFLSLFSFSAAILAGMGLEALLIRLHRDADTEEGEPAWLVIAAIVLAAVALAAGISSVDEWVSIWRWLPIALGVLAVTWVIWARRRKGPSYAVLATMALALVVVDLVSFNAVLSLTSNRTMPLEEFTAQPHSLSFLQSETGVYRIYTQEKDALAASAQRESYYPNLSLVYGLPTGNAQLPLVPQRYAEYTSEMTPAQLNLLGVKYYLIPQVKPGDAASDSYDLDNPFAYNPVGSTATVPLMVVEAFEIESYVSHSVEWRNGEQVARLTAVAWDEDEVMDYSMILGSHTAEWAYDRIDISQALKYPKPAIAWSFPARTGIPPADHPGYVYRARFTLHYPSLTQGFQVAPAVPAVNLHVERITLIDEQGNRYLLSHLQGKSDHTLAYLSDDVAIFRNNDVLPRIFLTYEAQAVPDDREALAILRSGEFDPRQEVLLATGQVAAMQPPTEGAERVELTSYDSRRVVARVLAPVDAYLVLTDAWYPGWQVRVDGQEAALLRADLMFRAVHLTAGEHTVEFTYAPASFRIGLMISAAALLLVLGLWFWGRKRVPLR